MSYDTQMGFFGRVVFGDSRAWVCSQATGNTLEVAIGTPASTCRFTLPEQS